MQFFDTIKRFLSPRPVGGAFQESRLTIRIKLMTIISVIVALSLGLMIFLATYFFLADSRIRVEENNMKLTNVTSASVSSLINSVRQIAEVAASGPAEGARLERTLFGGDRGWIFFGEYRAGDPAPRQVRSLINRQYLIANDLAERDIAGLTTRYAGAFQRCFQGSVSLVNASPGFRSPIIGLCFPYERSAGEKSALIVFQKMDSFLAAFQSEGGGITQNIMVSEDGSVVAHSDTRVVLAGASMADSPIVDAMRRSRVDNGLMRYTEKGGEAYLGAYGKMAFAGVGIISTVREDLAFEAVYGIRRRNLLLMGAVICLALIVVYFFASGISRPIKRLTGAARLVEEGNYDVNLPPESRDEIGVLTNTFNSMTRGLRERENLKVSFGKFVNKELAELSLSGELHLGGERKECAIFFSDVRGFTAMSERLRPEEVVEFLNQYFSEMVRCVNETHGTVDKFIGDALMAVWGALKSYGNNTENAINASLMMRAALLEFNRSRGTGRKPAIHIGCGINTGPVVAGQIGSDEKLEYTVIGDAVNLASRVESLTKHFGVDILITQHSLEKVKNTYRVVKMDEMRVKGKAKPVVVYAVLGRMDDPGCPRSVEELRERVGIEFDAKAHGRSFKDAKYSPA